MPLIKAKLLFLFYYCWEYLCVYITLDPSNGINQDEAFAGYEAYSLLNYGKTQADTLFPYILQPGTVE